MNISFVHGINQTNHVCPDRRIGVCVCADRRIGVCVCADRRIGVCVCADRRIGVCVCADRRIGVCVYGGIQKMFEWMQVYMYERASLTVRNPQKYLKSIGKRNTVRKNK